ncbi:hypothetical protein HHX47_DHR1000231 [Lentinula edodes]|nr:hypothetical protein HHX47_DHR1000231 [Lentinula edodes]
MRRTMEERRAELMHEYLPTVPTSADVRTEPSTESGASCSSCDSTINMESKVVQPLTKSPDQILSCKGWTLSSLLNDNKNFHAAPRISVSKVTEKLLASSDADGIPFVIEGLQHLPGWRKELLSVDWLKDDSLLKESERLYGKDLETPKPWIEWLHRGKVVPSELLPTTDNLLVYLPESAQVDTLMSYIGIGDTFTPSHKDLCASHGHNLMCYTENGGSSFWFMTRREDARKVTNYFHHKLGHDIDHESCVTSVQDFANAPFPVYIIEQKLGDLVIVPRMSCHQVVNHGGLTVKMSWSRMSLKSISQAVYYELPLYRRASGNEVDIGKQSRRLAYALRIFDDVLQNECVEDYASLPCSSSSENLSCDFCGADIFQSFLECQDCFSLGDLVRDPCTICPGCYAEGRSCRCQSMRPKQLQPLDNILQERNKVIEGLQKFWKTSSNEGVQFATKAALLSGGAFKAACLLARVRQQESGTPPRSMASVSPPPPPYVAETPNNSTHDTLTNLGPQANSPPTTDLSSPAIDITTSSSRGRRPKETQPSSSKKQRLILDYVLIPTSSLYRVKLTSFITQKESRKAPVVQKEMEVIEITESESESDEQTPQMQRNNVSQLPDRRRIRGAVLSSPKHPSFTPAKPSRKLRGNPIPARQIRPVESSNFTSELASVINASGNSMSGAISSTSARRVQSSSTHQDRSKRNEVQKQSNTSVSTGKRRLIQSDIESDSSADLPIVAKPHIPPASSKTMLDRAGLKFRRSIVPLGKKRGEQSNATAPPGPSLSSSMAIQNNRQWDRAVGENSISSLDIFSQMSSPAPEETFVKPSNTDKPLFPVARKRKEQSPDNVRVPAAESSRMGAKAPRRAETSRGRSGSESLERDDRRKSQSTHNKGGLALDEISLLRLENTELRFRLANLEHAVHQPTPVQQAQIQDPNAFYLHATFIQRTVQHAVADTLQTVINSMPPSAAIGPSNYPRNQYNRNPNYSKTNYNYNRGPGRYHERGRRWTNVPNSASSQHISSSSRTESSRGIERNPAARPDAEEERSHAEDPPDRRLVGIRTVRASNTQDIVRTSPNLQTSDNTQFWEDTYEKVDDDSVPPVLKGGPADSNQSNSIRRSDELHMQDIFSKAGVTKETGRCSLLQL